MPTDESISFCTIEAHPSCGASEAASPLHADCIASTNAEHTRSCAPRLELLPLRVAISGASGQTSASGGGGGGERGTEDGEGGGALASVDGGSDPLVGLQVFGFVCGGDAPCDDGDAPGDKGDAPGDES